MKLTPLYAIFCPIESTSTMNFVCKTLLNSYLTVNLTQLVKSELMFKDD